MEKNKYLKFLFLGAFFEVVFFSCGRFQKTPGIAGFDGNAPAKYYTAGRALLSRKAKEAENYGLYSYILFSKRPNREQKEIYFALLKSYFNSIQAADDLEELIDNKKINLVYLPVARYPNFDINNSVERFATWALHNYDYARARVYLDKIGPENLLDGPYIVSYNTPIIDLTNVNTNYLIQDFSKVADERIVDIWMNAFLKQSSKMQYWDGEYLNSFSDELRNNIALAAHALEVLPESLAWWKRSMKDWIAMK